MQKKDPLTGKIIECAIEVHRNLGPGLLESAYQIALCHELHLNNLGFERELILPVSYKGVHLDAGYRLDIIVEKKVIIELKAVKEVLPVHYAQLLTYLKLTGLRKGLLINFNVELLRDGIKRIVK